MKNYIQRLLASALCLVVLVSAVPTVEAYAAPTPQVSEKDQAALDDLSQQYDELEKEQERLQSEINKAKSEKDKQLAQKQQLDSQMSATQQQITLLTNRINLLESNIAQQEEAIAELEEEIDLNYDKFKDRMRVSYMAGEANTISLLLGADSFSDFLARAEITSRIAQSDRELIAALEEDLATLNAIKEQLAKDKADVENSRVQMGEKKEQLGGQIDQVQKQIQDITALENQIKNNKAAIDKMMAEVQNEINNIYASYTSVGTYDGGIMAWPVPNYPNITSHFGWRFNNTDFHTGIDISGGNVYGKNIVAAADGTVMKVVLTYRANVGYGRYLMIDHGSNISTLYGHTSEILVTEGQKVTKGQPVARVGSTGWSTGPHLHFEVREDGKAVNPLNGYLKK